MGPRAASGDIHAAKCDRTLRAIICAAALPTGTDPLDNDTFQKLVMHWGSSDNNRASLAMGALACFLRGTAGRCEDALRLERSHVVDNGVGQGFDFVFPKLRADGTRNARKGDRNNLTLIMPEFLDDGFPIYI